MMDLAIVSIAMQQYHKLFTARQALRRGTLFAELEKPWQPCDHSKGDNRYESDQTESC